MVPQLVRKLSDNAQFTLMHICGWIAYAVYLMMLNHIGDQSFQLGHLIGYLIPFIAVFYTSLYCLRFFNKKHGLLLGSAALVIMFAIICLVVYVYVYTILPAFGVRLYLTNSFHLGQFVRNILEYTVRFFIFALLYFFIQNYYRKKLLQAKSEIALLRAQIQPHFLYNTLNVFYSQAQSLNNDLADNIHRLSRIMRYTLEQAELNNETVLLRQELKQLQFLIEINQARFSHGLFITYEFNDDIEDLCIPPLSLMTLVENAFKHGDLKDEAMPLTIAVTTSPNHLHFYCSNKKRSRPVYGTSSGVGMSNLKKRLDYSFKDRYKLVVTNEPAQYTVSLTINY
jgi:sensor histidine kinase YesM